MQILKLIWMRVVVFVEEAITKLKALLYYEFSICILKLEKEF